MISLFALYRRPENEAAFLDHYRQHHLPLARRMPGLLSLDWGHPTRLSGDGEQWYLVAEMRFSNRMTLDAALRSDEGRAASHDVQEFAADLITMKVVEWE